MFSKKQKQWTTLGGAGAVITILTMLYLIIDLPEKIDPLMTTAVEAQEAHDAIRSELMAENDQQQHTQAAFNAYALRSILEQEIKVLELQVESEADEEDKDLLKVELLQKRQFIRDLEAERLRQLTKGGDDSE